jgi:nucleotide-binding universal stress UspA family protein
MEKILLAIDAIKLNQNALEFACYLGRLTKSKVTGVFLENLEAEESPVLRYVQGMSFVDWDTSKNAKAHQYKLEMIEKNINYFKDGCIKRETNFSLHHDRGVPVEHLVQESRFADVMVMDAETSFNDHYEGSPTEFVKNVLKNAECPVIIAPERFTGIDEIIFTYNGSASSVFAIKQFTYLFPQLYNKKVTILQVNENGEWRDPDKHKFKEWLKEHYTDLNFEVLQGSSDTRLFDYLHKRRNIFLVMGAYGRNALSQYFKRSHADLLIKTITQPIFIAHI